MNTNGDIKLRLSGKAVQVIILELFGIQYDYNLFILFRETDYIGRRFDSLVVELIKLGVKKKTAKRAVKEFYNTGNRLPLVKAIYHGSWW